MRINEIEEVLLEMGYIAHLWHFSDIQKQAKDEHDLDLSEDEARVILMHINYNIDCELGISWTTLDCAIEDFKSGGISDD